VEFLSGNASDRKLRLFAVAGCRRIWHLLIDERSHHAVEVAERYADGQATEEERQAACDAACAAMHEQQPWGVGGELLKCSAVSAASAGVNASAESWTFDGQQSQRSYLADNPAQAVYLRMKEDGQEVQGVKKTEKAALASLLRDIFGRLPFRPVTLNPAWRTSNVAALAQAIYDDRAFDRMPILADALEDAGCDNADILNHCRQPGEHVRGCWVVDLVLGKE